MFERITILTLFILLFVSGDGTSLNSDSDTPSAYELLQGYNFPPGLLPKGITHYDLDKGTGRFHAYWKSTCSFSLQGTYQLRYKPTIGGIISKNKLSNLSGVSVKILFFWLNIVEVTRVGDDIEFSVGIASASFPIGNFEECPQCGCGMDCGGEKEMCPYNYIMLGLGFNAWEM